MSDLVSVASDESDAQCRTEGARAPADNAGEGASREAALLPSDAKVNVPEIPAQLGISSYVPLPVVCAVLTRWPLSC